MLKWGLNESVSNNFFSIYTVFEMIWVIVILS